MVQGAINIFSRELLGANKLHDASTNYYESNPGLVKDGVQLFKNRLICDSCSMLYSWPLPKCYVAIHHGNNGTTATTLHAGVPQSDSGTTEASSHAGVPQIIFPFILDQFYWVECMNWIGVAPPPLKKQHLILDKNVVLWKFQNPF